MDTGLTPEQLGFIYQTLTPYVREIEEVRVFGSRATGRYTPYSDIDLVLYGPILQSTLDRLWTLFEESNLPFRVDILGYNLLTHAGLRAHIDAYAKPFLEKKRK